MLNHTDCLKLTEFYLYLDFIKQCSNKQYSSDLVLHQHHIIPKCFGSERKETVLLSVEDHIEAHIILSNCFTEGSYEQIANLRAAKVLQKKSIKYKKELEKLYEYSTGVGNPFWGKSHTEETRAKLRASTIRALTNKKYEDRYGERAIEEREKRRKGVKAYYESVGNKRSAETLEKMKKNAKPRLGGSNGMAKSVMVGSTVYKCLKDAMCATGLSAYKLKRLETFKYL